MKPVIARKAENQSLRLFTETSETVAGEVISAYSTSFGLATRLLGRRHRAHIRNIYAMVRVADEIVDGVASEAGLTHSQQQDALQRFTDETHRAMQLGYSTDMVLHAFARTAREAGISESLTEPFFASMRADLRHEQEGPAVFSAEEHASYVYGSAEVVGLMCVRVFVRDESLTEHEEAEIERGARSLGAAFQNINFLRDLADDTARLGRSYLGVNGQLTESDRDRWVAEVRAQLAAADDVIPLLPRDARAAVRSALMLFAELTNRVAKTPTAQLYSARIRVPDPVKLSLAIRAVTTTALEGKR
ncbi:MAG: squalene/phytoene synthase family protein [Leucobacter sp.]